MCSHVSGRSAGFIGVCSHVSGRSAGISGVCSHMSGRSAGIAGVCSHMSGRSAGITGMCSHVSGRSARITGVCAHVSLGLLWGLNLGAHTCTTVGNFISMFLDLCILLSFHFLLVHSTWKLARRFLTGGCPPLFISRVSFD